MNGRLILATENGCIICSREEDHWWVERRGLEGQSLNSAIAREGVILAGGREGVYRSDDMGRSWQEASSGLSVRHVRWMAYHPDVSDFELAGTEPAAIFISRDGANTWRECPEVAQLREKHGWYLPYSPEAGCVRGFAINGRRAYAAVEDGGVLISQDGGEHWILVEGSRGDPDHRPPVGYVHSDVHSIAVHPSSSDLVYAPTGGGLYRSMDGGKTWMGLYLNCYCRAVWVDPENPQHIILGPADGVDRNGRIERSRDGGRSWEMASQGLSVPWSYHMVERFTQAGDELLAVLSNGELVAAPLQTLAWRQILLEVSGIRSAAVMQD